MSWRRLEIQCLVFVSDVWRVLSLTVSKETKKKMKRKKRCSQTERISNTTHNDEDSLWKRCHFCWLLSVGWYHYFTFFPSLDSFSSLCRLYAFLLLPPFFGLLFRSFFPSIFIWFQRESGCWRKRRNDSFSSSIITWELFLWRMKSRRLFWKKLFHSFPNPNSPQ